MRCPACGTPNRPEAVRCEKCAEKLVRPRAAPVDEGKGLEQVQAPNQAEEDEERTLERRPRQRQVQHREEDADEAYDADGGISTLIPYKNPKALASYYCGVFSLIPVIGLPLGIVALVLGILGLRHRSVHPKAKGTAHAIVGMVLGLVGTLHCIPIGVGALFWALSEKH